MTEKNIKVRPNDNYAQAESTTEGWLYRPLIDIVEDANETTVFCDMPGTIAQDVAISVDNRMLKIHGKVRRRHPTNTQYMAHEYGIGDFDRRVPLVGEVDIDRISAQYERGVLTINLPKSEKSKPRSIPVQPA